ncbi:uncharacterized protein LOC128874118 isoform X1 [Hylaeus volcanicus]|uniref:uncharacterized protein LOC128874118 isoform X1 n=2 Tax=Hylaeus volcanicus TaxID=313075 RepID=UPI0023B779B0|nr:uncharacterized protein LOC128874118 isoform X1 [Hylaeus volcanicus]
MAQYYNFVTNASGTLSLEDLQRICSVEGQNVQLVFEDVNNDDNGSQQFLTYTSAQQNNEQAIFSQQINLGNQIPTTQLDQGQNFFIIKTNTNELSSSQGVLKTTAVNANVLGGNIGNTVDNKGSKTLIGCNNDGQQIQWIKMQKNNISENAVSKQSVSSLNTGLIKRKPPRSYQNRNRHSINSVQTESLPASDRVNVTSDIGTQIQTANVSNTRASKPSQCNKSISPIAQNVTLIPTQVHNSLSTVLARPQAPNILPKTLKPHQPKMEQTKLKQMQNDQRLQGGNVQRLINTSSPTAQGSLNNLAQRQQTMILQQRQHTSSGSQIQKQQPSVTQKSQYEQQSSLSSPSKNVNSMDTEPLESSSLAEQPVTNQQNFQSQTDSENSSSESIAYLQQVIDNPSNTIVQHQIQGNTAKMLVTFANGEQRLITFDIPNEDCTVQDLLEQANIVFCGSTSVSLVSDPTLGINYIVDARSGSVVASHDTTENDNSQENTNSSLDNSHSSPDENSNPVHQNEEPIYIEGMLAVCSHCGISSIDFNRCLRCKRKLPKDVKSIPMTMGMQEKKETMLSVDTFYKKNNERNSSAKLEKLERDGSVYKRGRGRGRGVAKPKPVHKEPECLTISSDEEEEGKSKKSEGSNNSTFSHIPNNSFSDEMETILEKEPVITNNSISSPSADYAMENEDIIKDNSVVCPHTSLLCRTVRIGSYKYIPQERIVISQNGVRFAVPLLEDENNFVTLEVKFQDIVKVLIHFGKSMPVLFFYTCINTGAMIRELLGMQDPKGPYYDPIGKDHTHKRITLLPEMLSEESKVVLKSLFSRKGLLEELSSKEANDILIRASPKDSPQVQSLSRKDSQASLNSSNSNGGIQTITVYPPPPAKGGIAINTEDYLCLGEDQFLNDVIIDFYLKYLTLEVLSESDQHRTHVFSSYFYKRLTSPHTQAVESSVPLSPAAKRHARVQKWTKNVNIFQKDFIIIPINEHAHWFLAIICFPGLVGEVFPNRVHSEENDTRKTTQKSKKLKEIKLQAVTIGNTTLSPVTTTITIDQPDDGSERDEAEGDDEEMEMDSEDDDELETTEDKNRLPKVEQNIPQEKNTVKVPCILIFDSLASASRARVVATLRDYLSCEYVAKMGSEKVFSKDTIKGASLKVPQQSNFTDCGLYVLQYVESFFKNPIKDYTLPIKTLKNWFEEITVTRKREELSELLIKLVNSTKRDKNITLPVVHFPTQDGKLKTKTENHGDGKSMKPDVEDKKKSTGDGENRISNNMPNQIENTEPTNEMVNKTTYQIIPYSLCTSSSSTENNPTEMVTESKISHTRSSSETMSYLKSKRIPRLMSRTENQDDPQLAKKHKGDSFDSCK